MQVKQKIINGNSLGEITNALECAIDLGWTVQHLTADGFGNWIAVLARVV